MRRRDLDRLLLSEDFGETLASIKRSEQARTDHPWAADLIRVLAQYPQGLRRRFVLERLRALRGPAALEEPSNFESAVQSAFQRRCGQSDTFAFEPAEDIFWWPKGKGAGIWAVRRDRAEAWLHARNLPPI